jgi:hypothetical protein
MAGTRDATGIAKSVLLALTILLIAGVVAGFMGGLVGAILDLDRAWRAGDAGGCRRLVNPADLVDCSRCGAALFCGAQEPNPVVARI